MKESVFSIEKFTELQAGVKILDFANYILEIINKLNGKTPEEVSDYLLSFLRDCFTCQERKEIVSAQEARKLIEAYEEKRREREQKEIDKSTFVEKLNDEIINELNRGSKFFIVTYFFVYPSNAEYFCNKIKQAGYKVTCEPEYSQNNYRFIISLEEE